MVSQRWFLLVIGLFLVAWCVQAEESEGGDIDKTKEHFWVGIGGGQTVSLEIVDKKVSFTGLEITPHLPITSVLLKLHTFVGKPDGLLTPKVRPYQYLQIDVPKLIDGEGSISFIVQKSWVEENSIEVESIDLYVYATDWKPLEANMVSENDEVYNFEAETPVFSYFVIAGKSEFREVEVIQEFVEGSEPEVPVVEDVLGEPVSVPDEKGFPWFWTIMGVVVCVAAYFLLRNPKK